jgi:hypothetical protein
VQQRGPITVTAARAGSLALKETEAKGKALLDTTLIWQNIVHSQGQPIVAGQTYDVQDYLYPGTVKTEAKLQQVVYKDLSTWDAPK